MITEIPYTIALLYPCINHFWWNARIRKEVEEKIKHNTKEFRGIEIFREKSDYVAPTFVQVGSVMVPVGGGKTTNNEIVASAYISTDNKDVFVCFRTVDIGTESSRTFTGYINNNRHLEKTCKYYNLNSSSIPAIFPLSINKYYYKNGIYSYSGTISKISANRENLIKEVLWHKRMPLTITIPTIAGLCITGGWLRYYMFEKGRGNYSAYSYYPPFHYKRIARYFNEK